MQSRLKIWKFYVILPISVNSTGIYEKSLQLNFKFRDQSEIWIQYNIRTKFIERLTNTLRIWTFQCNCSYISIFYVELQNNIAIKLQMNSDKSEIWFSAIFTPNLFSFWQIHFEFEHFNAIVPIYQSFLWRTTKYYCN